MATTIKMYATKEHVSGLSIEGREVGGGSVAGFDVPIEHVEVAKSHGLSTDKPAGTPATSKAPAKAPVKAPEPPEPEPTPAPAPRNDMVESVGETVSGPRRGPRGR